MILLREVLIDKIHSSDVIHVFMKTYGNSFLLAKGEAIDLISIIGQHIQYFSCNIAYNQEGITILMIEL